MVIDLDSCATTSSVLSGFWIETTLQSASPFLEVHGIFDYDFLMIF